MEKRIAADYLRLSITDKCNLNCIYCTPLKKEQFLTHEEVLRYEEIVELVKVFIKAGITKLRITGGEPLIKKGIIELIAMLRDLKGLEEISMTTNGLGLDKCAASLKKAGLDRINISIDTLKKVRFKFITGSYNFEDVWKGIEASIKAGFSHVKLNVVPMANINDDEIVDFARLVFKYPLIVRFIEFFHTNQRSQKLRSLLIPSEKVREEIVKELGPLEPASQIKGHGPASYYTFKNALGSIGFISGITGDFCHRCNRIRVDCAGRISPCLFSGYIYDTRPLLKNSSCSEKLLEEINSVISLKSKYTKITVAERKIEMSSLGG